MIGSLSETQHRRRGRSESDDLLRPLRLCCVFLTCLTLAVGLLAACGAAGPGDAARGQQLFMGEVEPFGENLPTCTSCHPVEAGTPGDIGTNLSNIGNRAAVEVPGQAADEYLRLAIVEPDAYLAGGYQEGIHYREYGAALSGQQINDLIAYMLTLRSGAN